MNRAIRLVLVLGIVLSGCSRGSGIPDESVNKIRQAGVLRVAIDPSYPPFSFLDDGGELVGYDVDLSREVASRLGVQATFVAIEITTILDALIARKADAAISAVSPSWEYAKQIGFSQSYFNAGQVLVARQGTEQKGRPDEMENAKLGVEIGSAGELEGRKLAQAKPSIILAPFDSLDGGLGALASGRLDAVIADRVTAAVLARGQKGLRIAGEPFTFEPYVIAVRGSDRTLLKEIDAILEVMRSSGFLAGLERRWIDSES